MLFFFKTEQSLSWPRLKDLIHLHFLINKEAPVLFKHPYSYANITVNNIHTGSQMGSLVVPPSIANWLRNMVFCQEYQLSTDLSTVAPL